MPRHNPTPLTEVDDGSGRHGRRLERDSRARTRRRARRLETVMTDGLGLPRSLPRQERDSRELDQQVAKWRSELALHS